MYWNLTFVVMVACAWRAADSAPARKAISYATKANMPSNVHYIVDKDHEDYTGNDTVPEERIKLSCGLIKKAAADKLSDPKADESSDKEGSEGEDCLKASGIITAPSRHEEGHAKCDGMRRKDLNGLCRKIWDK